MADCDPVLQWHCVRILNRLAAWLQIDGLIVNCSAFNPTPSLSAAVVNHFKMRQDVRTYNLSGMGCAASVIGIDLAMELLAVSSFSLSACALSSPGPSTPARPKLKSYRQSPAVVLLK